MGRRPPPETAASWRRYPHLELLRASWHRRASRDQTVQTRAAVSKTRKGSVVNISEKSSAGSCVIHHLLICAGWENNGTEYTQSGKMGTQHPLRKVQRFDIKCTLPFITVGSGIGPWIWGRRHFRMFRLSNSVVNFLMCGSRQGPWVTRATPDSRMSPVIVHLLHFNVRCRITRGTQRFPCILPPGREGFEWEHGRSRYRGVATNTRTLVSSQV